MQSLDGLAVKAKAVNDELRRLVITSDLESLKSVVKWLSGEDIPYARLVEGIFGIVPRIFGHKEIRRAQQAVEDACVAFPGSGVCEKVLKWEEENRISGEALKKMIETTVAERTREVAKLFAEKIFAFLPAKVEDGGVVYKTVTGEPWSGYNYYQRGHTSINVFNLDMPFNRHRLITTLCHEYEHHVANLFTEKCYLENKFLDLAAVLLHTKRCIISEGTANCAKDFLDFQSDKEHGGFIESLNELRSMVDLNVAYMLNVEKADDETAGEYVTTEGYRPREYAEKLLRFSKPLNPNGKPNFFKPYAYTYYFGKRDYVLPTFQKAQRKGKLKEFFRTLYLNPYTRSSATWAKAFSRI